MPVASIRKALIALAGALAVLAVALTGASDGGTSVTAAEWVQVALAALAAVGVYATPNRR